MKEFKDKAGRVIKQGDLIVYSVSYGRSPGLSYGKVLDIVESKSEWTAKKTKVKVWGVDKPWSPGGAPTKNTKPGLLEYSQRMLIVTRDQIPEDILTKLDAIELETE